MSKPIIPCMVHPIEDSKELNMHVHSVITLTIESRELSESPALYLQNPMILGYPKNFHQYST